MVDQSDKENECELAEASYPLPRTASVASELAASLWGLDSKASHPLLNRVESSCSEALVKRG